LKLSVSGGRSGANVVLNETLNACPETSVSARHAVPETSSISKHPPITETIDQSGELRFVTIESFRALGALVVMVWHVYQQYHKDVTPLWDPMFRGAALAMNLLFALSGYLIFWPFLRHYFGGGSSIALKTYSANRALRMLPLYWTAVVINLARFIDAECALAAKA
jgi:hypothetical protein